MSTESLHPSTDASIQLAYIAFNLCPLHYDLYILLPTSITNAFIGHSVKDHGSPRQDQDAAGSSVRRELS